MHYRIRVILNVIKLKIKFKRAGSQIGKVISASNSKYVSVENNVRIKDYCRIECYDNWRDKKYHPKFEIASGVIIGYNFTCLVTDDVKIGNDTILASNVMITSENHGINPESEIPFHAQLLESKPVSIGKGCWIGQNVSILPGVSIGDKSVIASGAVVTRDIPDFSIAAGIPAKVIKQYNFETHCWEKMD